MQKKLYRNTENGKLGGVAAGLADYFNVDVTLVRLVFVLLGLFDGAGLLLYAAMFFIVPEAPERAVVRQTIDQEWY